MGTPVLEQSPYSVARVRSNVCCCAWKACKYKWLS